MKLGASSCAVCVGVLLVLSSLHAQPIDEPFTVISTNLPGAYDGALAWGDIDNDGDLDLVLTGSVVNGNRLADVFRNDGPAGFVPLNLGIPGVASSAVDWGDYDNDGDIDLAIAGTALGVGPFTRVYRNNGNGNFQNIGGNFPGILRGFVAWVDYNNDGWLDLSLGGYGPGCDTEIHRNNGDGTFTRVSISLPCFSDGSAGWADVDNDADLDLLLTSVADNSLTRLLRNQEGAFTDIFSGLPPVGTVDIWQNSLARNAGHAWGDFNQDGALDVLIWGWQSNNYHTYVYTGRGNGRFDRLSELILSTPSAGAVACADYDADGLLDFVANGGLYRGRGDGSFLQDTSILAQIALSAAAWGDYDGDGDLDLIVSGRGSTPQTLLYRNNRATPNAPPGAPSNPTTTLLSDNYVALSWDPPSDAETTNRNGFTYNLRVGTSPGAIDRMSPHADLTTGLRRLARPGNAGETNRWLLINLPPGTYYWSVQAIDPGFAGSPFSVEASFTVTNTRPTISSIPGQVTYPGRATAPISFTVGDRETLPEELVVSGSSSSPALVANSNIVFGGSGSNRTVTVTPLPNQRGSTLITIVVTDGGTGTAKTSFILQINEFTWVSAPVPSFFYAGSAAWGDYDRDGDLDLYVNGGANGHIYRNDSGAFGVLVGTFAWLGYAAAAWGDYDSDGDIDLAVMGTAGGGISFYESQLYQNLGNQLFTNRVRIPQVGYGSMQWADYDNDGDLDLLEVGQYNNYAERPVSLILRNEGATGFTVLSNYVAGVAYGVGLWGDFDNDGFPDVFLSGSTNAFGVQSPGPGGTRVYRNNRNGTFTEMPVNLPGLSSSAAALGDYDNDGDLDIALCGSHQTLGPMTRIYRNDGNWAFTLVTTNLINVTRGSLAWGDFDNDNDLDLMVSGSITGDPVSGTTRLYRNTGGGNFVDTGLFFPGIVSGTVAWADYDNDGDLDLVIDGTYYGASPFPGIYQNNLDPGLAPIPAPANLRFERLSDNTVSLFWSAQRVPNDTFNVSVRRSDGTQVVPAQADLTTGFRYVPERGNAAYGYPKIVRRLPRGTYEWSVQAIDMRQHGSPFSTNGTFVIDTPLPPTMDLLPNIVVNEDAPPQSRTVTGIYPGDTLPQHLSLGAYTTNINLFANVDGRYGSPKSTGQVEFALVPNANGRGYVSVVVSSLLEGGQRMSVTNTAVVDILPVNDRPLALSQTLTNREDSPLQILLSGSDVDGDALTYSIVTPPQFGALSGSAPFLVYRPATNFFGNDRFWFRVNDGATNSDPNTVNIVVTPERDVEIVTMSMQRLPDGHLQLSVRGEPYQDYMLEACMNLKDWYHLQTLRGTASGEITIQFWTGDLYNFYRARSLE